MTWNVHRGRGSDGLVNPDRVMDVIRAELAPFKPDILTLQEADDECPPHARVLDVARVEADTGLRSIHTEPRLRWGNQSDGFLGTILFVHAEWGIIASDVIDLPGHCYRGAVVVDLQKGPEQVRVIAAHLSLTQWLRAVQMRTIGQYVRRRPDMPLVVLGDLNEWRPWGGLAFSQRLFGADMKGPSLRTFPSNRPILPLDRVLASSGARVEDAQILRSDAIAAASDHCPLFANVQLNPTRRRYLNDASKG